MLDLDRGVADRLLRIVVGENDRIGVIVAMIATLGDKYVALAVEPLVARPNDNLARAELLAGEFADGRERAAHRGHRTRPVAVAAALAISAFASHVQAHTVEPLGTTAPF